MSTLATGRNRYAPLVGCSVVFGGMSLARRLVSHKPKSCGPRARRRQPNWARWRVQGLFDIQVVEEKRHPEGAAEIDSSVVKALP